MLDFLFSGGPSVFQHGLNLCAKEGVRIPFGEAQIMRLRWTLPTAFYALAMIAVDDYPQDQKLGKVCSQEYAIWMSSRDHIRGKIGDYVVLPSELDELRRSGNFDFRGISELREVSVSEGELLRIVSVVRLKAILPILAGTQKALSNSGGKVLGMIKGLFAGKPSAELVQFARISALATCVNKLVTAEEPEADLLSQAFITDVLGEAQKVITHRFQLYFEASRP